MKPIIFLAFANDLSRSLGTDSEHDLISSALKNVPQVQRLTLSKESLRLVFQEAGDSLQIFHFGGHGRRNTLYLSECKNNALAGDYFVELLSKYPVKLAVLNACHSREIALKLQEKGISAIGTEGEISDEKALRFAQSFYGHLAAGNPLKQAFERAKIVAETGETWQLFTQNPYFQLFKTQNEMLAETLFSGVLTAFAETGGLEFMKNLGLDVVKDVAKDTLKKLGEKALEFFKGKPEADTLELLESAVSKQDAEKFEERSEKVLDFLKSTLENDPKFKAEVEGVLKGLDEAGRQELSETSARMVKSIVKIKGNNNVTVLNSNNVTIGNTFGKITGGFRVGDNYGTKPEEDKK